MKHLPLGSGQCFPRNPWRPCRRWQKKAWPDNLAPSSCECEWTDPGALVWRSSHQPHQAQRRLSFSGQRIDTSMTSQAPLNQELNYFWTCWENSSGFSQNYYRKIIDYSHVWTWNVRTEGKKFKKPMNKDQIAPYFWWEIVRPDGALQSSPVIIYWYLGNGRGRLIDKNTARWIDG